MRIGIPREIKSGENRVGATPDSVYALQAAGHRVQVEKGAGKNIGFTDEMYRQAGAQIVDRREELYENEMIIKVKEPLPPEYPLLKEGQILFCYLHLAPDPQQTKALLERKVIGIAYETVTDRDGRLPLLVPMSEIAGRLSIQVGATSLQIANGGRGVLLGGIPGVKPAHVVVLGGGIVGMEAMRMALGLSAEVTLLDHNLNRLRELDRIFPGVRTLYSTPASIQESLRTADLVVGSVLIPGKKAPKLVTREHLKIMQQGSVIVDVAIDQGGCAETSHPTTHAEPTYVVEGVVHYCVANMPAAVARTSTLGLTNATLPYALRLADNPLKAMREDIHLQNGLNVYRGSVTYQAVAEDLGYEYVPAKTVLSS
jgi:alanine dehydrogenase